MSVDAAALAAAVAGFPIDAAFPDFVATATAGAEPVTTGTFPVAVAAEVEPVAAEVAFPVAAGAAEAAFPVAATPTPAVVVAAEAVFTAWGGLPRGRAAVAAAGISTSPRLPPVSDPDPDPDPPVA